MPVVEDITRGQKVHLGQHTVSRDEIVEFARAWDPQPFHLDNSDRDSPFGDVIASGWHTASVFMRLYVAGFLNDATGVSSPGIDELRWPEPVYSGDVLTASLEVERIMPCLGHRDRAIVTLPCTLVNQRGRTVLSMKLHNIFLRRTTESGRRTDTAEAGRS
jgi:acyl dehydratase